MLSAFRAERDARVALLAQRRVEASAVGGDMGFSKGRPPYAALLFVLLMHLPIGGESAVGESAVRNHIKPETVCVSRAMCL
jgi:hypothetical protein